MNESRLHHLRRQQVLLREHLSWIEAEIARETTTSPVEVTLTPPASNAPPATQPSDPTDPNASADEADALLEQYAREERQNPADVRRGCFLLFFGALAVMAGGLTLIWFFRYR